MVSGQKSKNTQGSSVGYFGLSQFFNNSRPPHFAQSSLELRYHSRKSWSGRSGGISSGPLHVAIFFYFDCLGNRQRKGKWTPLLIFYLFNLCFGAQRSWAPGRILSWFGDGSSQGASPAADCMAQRITSIAEATKLIQLNRCLRFWNHRTPNYEFYFIFRKKPQLYLARGNIYMSQHK